MNDNNEPIETPIAPQKKRTFKMSKKRTLLIIGGAIVVLALLVVGVLLVRQSIMPEAALPENSINAQQANYKFKVSISITDGGFVPSTITVEKSTQLSFQNNGTTPHSIVADTETLKAEPTLGFRKNESTPVTLPSGNHSGYYNYTFQNSGTYHVHDGYNPTANLTVIVK